MDIYSTTFDHIMALPVVQTWPEFQRILEQIVRQRPKHWLLPVKACQAVGGSTEQVVPAVAAIACAQIGIVLQDDILDDDPRGEYHQLGVARTANIATAFQLAGLETVFILDTQKPANIQAAQSANQMMLTVALGQEMDILGANTEAAYWKIVTHKSASFFGTALHLGALLGGASEKDAAAIKRFGGLYGEMIQIHDDLSDTLTTPASPDWNQKRTPLPILFAQIVDHPAKQRFLELYTNISQPDALGEAQEILIHCGAVSYCIDQLLLRHLSAQKILEITQLVNQQPLNELMNEIIEPVWSVFNLLGMQPLSPFLTRLDLPG